MAPTIATSMFDSQTGFSWCEPDYTYNRYIAEWWNTTSNIGLIGLPLLNVFLIYPVSARTRHPRMVMTHVVCAFVGLASAYYHATLSLFGQLVDELAILWALTTVFCTTYSALTVVPKEYRTGRPAMIARLVAVAFSLIISRLGFIYPIANAFGLFCFAPLIVYISYRLTVDYAETLPKLTEIFNYSIVYFLISITVWFIDRLACDYVAPLGIIYLHAIFHVMIAISVYLTSITLNYVYIYEILNGANGDWEMDVKFFPTSGPIRIHYISIREKSVKKIS